MFGKLFGRSVQRPSVSSSNGFPTSSAIRLKDVIIDDGYSLLSLPDNLCARVCDNRRHLERIPPGPFTHHIAVELRYNVLFTHKTNLKYIYVQVEGSHTIPLLPNIAASQLHLPLLLNISLPLSFSL